jgi:Peptidase A4 family
MRRLNAPTAVFVVLLIAGVAVPAASAAAMAGPAQGLAPAVTGSVIPATSSNWAGYGAVGSAKHTVTSISASWVEPALTCTSKTAYVAFWVGIDGLVSSAPSVEQTGTLGYCSGGSAAYVAWWEIYPVNDIQEISKITVTPGDHFTASVTYSSSTTDFTMKITDTTTGATFTKNMAYSSAARETAECIAERPSSGSTLLPLADFGKVKFIACDATISGTNAGIGTFATVYQIDMVKGGKTLASTGALKSSKTFTVTWKHFG